MKKKQEEQENVRPQVTAKNNCHLRPRKFTQKRCFIELRSIESYCMKLITWEEAKPLVDMLEKLYGIDPPPSIKKMIRRIKRSFHQKLYGKAIKAKTVVMKSAHFKSMNHITRNKHVNLGDDYEKE